MRNHEEAPAVGEPTGASEKSNFAPAKSHNIDKQATERRRRSKWTSRNNPVRAIALRTEVYRLALFRRRTGGKLAASDWLWVLAQVLALAEEGLIVGKKGRVTRWLGLNFQTLKKAVAICDLGYVTDAEIEDQMHGAHRWAKKHPDRPVSGKYIGQRLKLTAAERDLLGIRFIFAIDQTDEHRVAARLARKRERDRTAARKKRKAKSRTEISADAMQRRREIARSGLSRATWYRQRAKQRASETHETVVSSHIKSSDIEATRSSHEVQADTSKKSDSEGLSHPGASASLRCPDIDKTRFNDEAGFSDVKGSLRPSSPCSPSAARGSGRPLTSCEALANPETVAPSTEVSISARAVAAIEKPVPRKASRESEPKTQMIPTAFTIDRYAPICAFRLT